MDDKDRLRTGCDEDDEFAFKGFGLGEEIGGFAAEELLELFGEFAGEYDLPTASGPSSRSMSCSTAGTAERQPRHPHDELRGGDAAPASVR